jgi:hypothetical protein
MKTMPNDAHRMPIAPDSKAWDWIVRGLGGLSSAHAERHRATVTRCQQAYRSKARGSGNVEFKSGACTSYVPAKVWTAAVKAAR